jgi:hypothetical protein
MDFPESAEAEDITAGKIVTTAGQDRGDAQLQAATKKGCFWLCRERSGPNKKATRRPPFSQ